MRNLFLIIAVLLTSSYMLNAQNFEEKLVAVEKQLSKQLLAKNVKIVGVADFSYMNMPNTAIGEFFADELNNTIFMSESNLTVVDRQSIRDALSGNQRSQSGPDHNVRALKNQLSNKVSELTGVNGYTTQSAMNVVGKMFKSKKLANVDAIVFGTLVDLGEELKLTVQVIKSDKKAEIIAMSSVRIPKTSDIIALMKN